MRHTNRRSSSAQRGPRSSSAKRATTPNRRLSDLPERPAWDATASNLDKYKLTAEELERRRASRVSKNRPLGADASRRSFVEAWAKHVTAGVLRPGSGGDTNPDQDSRPRGTPPPPAGALPINYSSVVDMLRKSPAPTSNSPGASRPPGVAGHSPSRDPSSSPDAGTPGDRGPEGNHHVSWGGTASPGRAEDEVGRAPGQRPITGSPVVGAGGLAGRTAAAAGAGAGAAGAGGDGGGGSAAVLRADMSITPVTMRPRFNPADTTTVIAFGGDSDSDEGPDREHVSGDNDYGGVSGGDSPGPGPDPMTAAFEAALFGRVGGAAAGAAPGASAAPGVGGRARHASGPHLAWASGGEDLAAPAIGSAAGDVERRLCALEAALATRGSGGLSAAAGSALAVEELAELRGELRKVQHDNAKLRQELAAFSTHASALLTQLQAQVQQLLRPAGTTAAAAGPLGVAPAVSSVPAPYFRQSQPSSFGAAAASTASAAAAAAAAAAATGPSSFGISASATAAGLRGSITLGPGDLGAGLGGPLRWGGDATQPPQPQQLQPQPQAPPLSLQQAASAARRNIFADIDLTAIRPQQAGPRPGARDGGGAGEYDVTIFTPAAAAGGVSGSASSTPYGSSWFARRQTDPADGLIHSTAGGGDAAAAAGAAYSPPIDVPLGVAAATSGVGVPGGPQAARTAVPVHNLDDVEATLPSFAAFRRSAGAAAFTSARPLAAGAQSQPQPASHAAAASSPSPYVPSASPPSASAPSAVVQPRSFPTQYQPRSLGGVIARPAHLAPPAGASPPGAVIHSGAASGGAALGAGLGSALLGAAAASATNAASGAYASAIAATAAAAAATGSDAAAAGLARAHSGLPQPLVFSVGPEFRTARASGLSADNSMSLSAHTAAAAAARGKAGGGVGSAGR